MTPPDTSAPGRRILALTDLGHGTDSVLEQAARQASRLGLALTLARAQVSRTAPHGGLPDPLPRLRRRARWLARRHGIPVHVTDQSVGGLQAFIELAAGFDLVFLACAWTQPRARSRWPRRALLRSPAPVWLVGTQSADTIDHILIGTPLDQRAAALTGMAHAWFGDVATTLCHAVQTMDEDAALSRDYPALREFHLRRARLDTVSTLERLAYPEAHRRRRTSYAIAMGDTAAALCQAAQADGAQLLLVGHSPDAPRLPFFDRWAGWSLLSCTPCDLLVVPIAARQPAGAGIPSWLVGLRQLFSRTSRWT